jgi:hypothetical protein
VTLWKVGADVVTARDRRLTWRLVVQAASREEANQRAWLFLEGRLRQGRLHEIIGVRVIGQGGRNVMLVSGFLEGRAARMLKPS